MANVNNNVNDNVNSTIKPIKKYKLYINLTKERYCHKCHKILNISKFLKPSNKFKYSSNCIKCKGTDNE